MSAVGRGGRSAEVRRTAYAADTSGERRRRSGGARVNARGTGPRVGAACQSGAVSTTPETEFAELTLLMREFTEERDWARFHDPKSLILALVGEVGELAELFQWVPAEDAASSVDSPGRRERVAEELADVQLYLVRLADVLGIDLAEAARSKLESGRRRFPAEGFRGVAPEKS